MAPDQRSTHSLRGLPTESTFTSSATGRRLGGVHPPTTTSTSLPEPLQASDIASSSHLSPPNHPVSRAQDYPAVHGATPNDHQNSTDENDTVIAVIGLTGAGKSSFINTAAGRTEVLVGNGLRSPTRVVQPVRCLHPDGRQNVVLLDTPGFDDTTLSDTRILRILAHWLKETYQNNIKLSGILYLQRILDVRMSGTPLRNRSIFKDLCGDDDMKNIVFVTTMWDELQDESVGSEREEQLRFDFWKDMISLGSRTCRFGGTRESAWEIIDCLDLGHPCRRLKPLQIQEEMVDRNLRSHNPTAAKTLSRFLVPLAGEFKKGLEKLRNKVCRVAGAREPSMASGRIAS